MDRIHTVCLIGSKVINDDGLKKVIQDRQWTLLTFNNATEALGSLNNNSNNGVIYILHDFEGQDFQSLHKSDKNVNRCERKNIFSPQIMKYHLAEVEEMIKEKGLGNGGIGTTIGKLFNFKLRGKKICISGVRTREDTSEWTRLVGLIRFMGGEDVKKVDIGTSFLISRSRKAEGDKYKTAVLYGIPVLTSEWLDHVWENRSNPLFVPYSPEILALYRMKAFEGLKLSFVNSNDKDLKERVKLTIANGGQVVDPLDHSCTHIIVDSFLGDTNTVQFDFDTLRNPLSPSTIHQYILYQEWFWLSIEIGGCIDEKRSDLVYPVQGTKNNPGPKASSLSEFRGTRNSIQSPGIDMSFSSFLSPNISSTTYTQSDTPVKGIDTIDTPVKKFDPKTATKRHAICMELFTTEGNYLDILRKMVHEIQKPLEEKKYLDAAEMKIIFGNLAGLLECHEIIYRDLEQLIVKDWNECNKIGDVFAKHGNSMFRAYSNFVNSFEFSKEMIAKCEEKSQQFHAFLMIARNKCGRQSLQDLFITPVQRIPRYLLLLNDIQKNTDPSNPDHGCIKSGISRVQQVLTQINENKRKTEGHVMMLDVVNEIEGGAHLLSSKRHFVDKVDVKMLLSENGTPTPWKGHPLTLLLFDDVLEICKKRSIKKSDSITSRNSSKSSNYKSGSSSGKKPYKHIEMVKLSNVSMVHEVEDDDEFDRMVFIRTKDKTDDRSAFKLFPFQLRSSDGAFMSKLKCYMMNEKENDFKDDIFKSVPFSAIGAIDFTYAEYLASTISKSSFGRAKAKLSRTFSMSRRQSVSTTNLSVPGSNGDYTHHKPDPITGSTTHLTGLTMTADQGTSSGFNLPKAPSTTPRRSSSRFMASFMSPLTSTLNHLGTPLSHFNRQISISSLALNQLTEKDEPSSHHGGRDSTDAFSLPSTPAPRKKKCGGSSSYPTTNLTPHVFVTPSKP